MPEIFNVQTVHTTNHHSTGLIEMRVHNGTKMCLLLWKLPIILFVLGIQATLL
jgi:hypothetical protein